jgi:hypothetical protein
MNTSRWKRYSPDVARTREICWVEAQLLQLPVFRQFTRDDITFAREMQTGAATPMVWLRQRGLPYLLVSGL